MFDRASKAGMMCWGVGGDVGRAGAPRQRPSGKGRGILACRKCTQRIKTQKHRMNNPIQIFPGHVHRTMCQTAMPTLARWTRCTTTTQNFKTLPFPPILVLPLLITRPLVASMAASRVCVLQGSAAASALPGRQSTSNIIKYFFGSCHHFYFSSLPGELLRTF